MAEIPEKAAHFSLGWAGGQVGIRQDGLGGFSSRDDSVEQLEGSGSLGISIETPPQIGAGSH